jgi:hypothetical protein
MTPALLLAGWLLPTAALADDDTPTDAPLDDQAELVPAGAPPRPTWGGVAVPLIGASTVDGFGFGLGGEVFRRPPGHTSGYDIKLTASLYVNTRFDYTNNLLRLQLIGDDEWLFVLGHQQWANLSYVGVGGADVIKDLGDDELGNGLISPYAVVGVAHRLGDGPWSVFGQLYARGGIVDPDPDRFLAEERPFGVDGGLYADLTAGIKSRKVDRWPMPHDGQALELGARIGGTWSSAPSRAMAGVVAEGMAWRPLGAPWLTGAGRLLVTKTVGERPFFEQDKVGNRWRDELGSEQALAGYGRTRTRGDGVVAALVEVRPRLFVVEEGFFDLEFYLSVDAELGYLFDRFDPGPPLPTIGINGSLLWQKAVQLRPFAAWGWRITEPGTPRRPAMQFGISIMDAL